MAKPVESSTSPRHSEASIAARMDRLPITPLHRRAVVVIGLGQFFDLYEIFLAGVLSGVLASQFKRLFDLDRATWGLDQCGAPERGRPVTP